ncbi:MAG TPA: nucleoid occlusion factor SlmA [Gammaproteobacteria bacterium]
MNQKAEKPSRRQQILEALAQMLESSPGERITTAGLAKQVGVSEAALYRHFASKAKMFEGLIEFIEETVFGLVNRIMADERGALARCEKIELVLLGFAARNPGMTRILIGDALTGENERLRGRVGQFFDRLETQFKQVLREGAAVGEVPAEGISATANLLLAVAEGRMNQFVRSGFRRLPTELWSEQWAQLAALLRAMPVPV